MPESPVDPPSLPPQHYDYKYTPPHLASSLKLVMDVKLVSPALSDSHSTNSENYLPRRVSFILLFFFLLY